MTTSTATMRPIRRSSLAPFLQIGALVLAGAAMGSFSSARIRRAGGWLPPVPDQVGSWEATDTPIPPEILTLLDAPQGLGREYNDVFNEPVRLSVISAGSFTSYHDPTVCVSGAGFNLTAVKMFPIDGPGSGMVRAMIFKRDDPRYGVVRMLMYYWQQNRDGTTATDAVMGSYRDIGPRFSTGYGDVVQGKQVCLVRIYAPIPLDDLNGAQTQRNVDTIAKAVYHSMKDNGVKDQ